MTKAVFLLDLSCRPPVVSSCAVVYVNLQGVRRLQKDRSTVETMCACVSETWHMLGQLQPPPRQYGCVPLQYESYLHSLCRVCVVNTSLQDAQWRIEITTLPSSCAVLLVVRGDWVLPRLLVGERSLHWSLTSSHSDDGGYSLRLLLLNGTKFPLVRLVVCHGDQNVLQAGSLASAYRWIGSSVRMVNAKQPETTLVMPPNLKKADAVYKRNKKMQSFANQFWHESW